MHAHENWITMKGTHEKRPRDSEIDINTEGVVGDVIQYVFFAFKLVCLCGVYFVCSWNDVMAHNIKR